MMLLNKLKGYFKDSSQYAQLEDALKQLDKLEFKHPIYNKEFAYGVVDIMLNVMGDFHTFLAAIYYVPFKMQILDETALKTKITPDALDILKSLNKLESIKINTKDTQVQNVNNMFIALAKDIRVILLKLSVTEQEVLSIDKFSKTEQTEIMTQSRDIYAPIAAMISIGHVKATLENETFKFFKPLEYAKLNQQLHKYIEERNKQINLTIQKIKREIAPQEFQVYGRQKQISSIYKKMEQQHLDLTKLYDIMAVRIIVNTVEECYAVLGKVHALYKPMGRFRDYIAQPKSNGYQSLHTIVIVDNGDPLEIQIRTADMHNYAEYGFAAHWAYKQKRKVNEGDRKIIYIRSVMDLYKQKSAEELLDALKIDVYSGNIYCQTPMGKILQFPEGATPIDFAYAIHSKIGDTCVGAKLNGKMVPLSTSMNNGDVVEIITNANSKGPSRDWLKFAKSSDTRSKINAYFKREMKDENIKKGKTILEAQAKAKALNLPKLMKDEWLQEVYDKYTLSSLEDMYASIGYGGISAAQVLGKLTALQRQEENIKPITEISELEVPLKRVSSKSSSAINVLGYNNLMTKFARCCNPLPGDEIVGYVSRGKGVTIHRKNCDAIKSSEDERLIECSWNDGVNETFTGYFTILAVNAPSTIATISRKISDQKLNIERIRTANKSKDQTAIYLGVAVKEKQQLNDLIYKLKNLSCVLDIYRDN